MSSFKKFFGNTEDVDAVENEDSFEAEEMPRMPPVKPGTVIAKGQIMEGALRGEGAVQIEGAVIGEISLHGAVVVAAGGTVTGPVDADVVRVAGHMEGNVTARSHLRLERTGRVDGDISTPSLVVDDGARFNGRCTTPETTPSLKESGDYQPPRLEELQFGANYTPDMEEEALI